MAVSGTTMALDVSRHYVMFDFKAEMTALLNKYATAPDEIAIS